MMKRIVKLLKEALVSSEAAAHLVALAKHKCSDSATYLEKQWVRTEVNSNTTDGVLLVFSNNEQKHDVWMEQHSGIVITILHSEQYEQVRENVFGLNLTDECQVKHLLTALVKEKDTEFNIIFDYRTDSRSDAEHIISGWLQFLHAMTQEHSLLSINGVVPVADDITGPNLHYLSLSALFRVMQKEHHDYILRTVKLSSESTEEDVIQELYSKQTSSLEIKYAKGSRYERHLTPATIPKNTHPTLTISENQTILISGGGGKIGFLISQWLITTYNCSVVLIGRSPEADVNKHYPLIEASNGVTYIQQDVTAKNPSLPLRKVLDRGIHGVIHLAGSLNDGLFRHKELSNWNEEISSKIKGIENLDAWTVSQPLRFFIAGSSLSAVHGFSGQSSYSYANAYLDHYIECREQLVNRGEKTGASISLNWSLWKDGGMSVSDEQKRQYKALYGIEDVSLISGITSIVMAISQQKSQLVVIDGDGSKILSSFNTTPAHVMATGSRPSNTYTKEDEHYTELLSGLYDIVEELMNVKREKLKPKTELAHYGFDSISFADLANKINQRFAINITPSVFFQYLHLDAITRYLLAECDIALEAEQDSIDESPYRNRGTRSADFDEDQSVSDDAVAIIGISGQFPGANNHESLWSRLVESADLVGEIPEDRWKWKEIFGNPKERNNQTNIRWGGFISDIDKFDRNFFKISARESELMDPQQRLFLQCSWSVVEDAGYNINELRGSNTAVYVGVASTDYTDLIIRNNLELEPHYSTGTGHSIVANRVSYLFDFHGPSEAIDTACSSSLIAVHKAAENIRSGECDLAIAGGVNVLLNPNLFISFSKAGMLSSDGKCKPFDKDANGYVRGEGVGAVLLKSYKQALIDHDHIYGVIKGSAVNHGGKTQSLTAPNPEAQAEVIRTALRKSRLDPSAISYIEAHGTGTNLGDPLETEGLKSALSASSFGKKSIGIGSIKSNIGHLETAAGIASVVKVLMSFKYEQIPSTIHFKELNPYVNLSNSPLYVVDQLQQWVPQHSEQSPLTAGISSFGFGGANAHIILQKPARTQASSNEAQDQLILISAESSSSLRNSIRDLRHYLLKYKSTISLVDIAFTLQKGRVHHQKRLALVVSSVNDLIVQLESQDEKIQESELSFDSCCSTGKLASTYDRRSQLYGIAKQWMNGETYRWEQLYDIQPHRISLPTYPFDKTKCWIDTNNSLESVQHSSYKSSLSNEEHQVVRINQKLVAASCDRISNGVSRKLLVIRFLQTQESKLIEELRNSFNTIEVLLSSLLSDAYVDQLLRSFINDDEVLILVENNECQDLQDEGRAYYGLLKQLSNLARYANSGRKRTKRLRFKFLHYFLEDAPRYQNPLTSLFKSFVSEQPSFCFKSVSLDVLDPTILEAELSAHFNNDEIIYTAGKRQNRQLVLDEPLQVPVLDGRFVERGVYLVTGGTGGIGRSICKDITMKGGIVIAVGRSTLTSQAINELKENAIIADYISCDICDHKSISIIEEHVSHHYGQLTGIVHAAGININRTINNSIDTDWEPIVETKVCGSQHLLTLAEHFRTDFLVLFGSMVGITGNAGQSIYAYSNACLDRISRSINERDLHLDCYAINWPLWDSEGMKMPASVMQKYKEEYGFIALSVEEGLRIWEKVLKAAPGNYSFLFGESQKIKQYVQMVNAGLNVKSDHIKEEWSNDRETYIQLFVETLAGVLRVSKAEIDIDETFENLGLDSLLINQFCDQVQIEIADFQVTLMFEYTTLRSLSEYCESQGMIQKNIRINNQADNQRCQLRGNVNNGPAPDDIAIIGIHGRYPDANNMDEYWLNLSAGKDSVSVVPEGRWDNAAYFSESVQEADCDKYYCQWGGFLSNPDYFDPGFFGISPKNAEVMDPQERLFIQSAWNALEDAGYIPLLKGSEDSKIDRNIGVFTGVTTHTYSLYNADFNSRGSYAIPNSQPWSIANRVSYLFNLTGPSVPIDTACSSSLAAIHFACKSIQSGECNLAIAGGVNLYLHPQKYIHLSNLKMLSPTGKCHAFSEKADGFVPGEGVGSIVLKPLKKAIRDGDHIRGVIKGSGINHGGRTNGYSVPSTTSQADVIEIALKNADVEPNSIRFIEAHGTGTSLGDPIEIAALNKVFHKHSRDSELYVGSVKSNIGHAESAAGIAGVSKIVQEFSQEQLVPSINCTNFNPKIKLSGGSVHIQRDALSFDELRKDTKVPLRAGVSSFGAGGTNVHLILEEYIDHRLHSKQDAVPVAIILSARDKKNLKQYAKDIRDFIVRRSDNQLKQNSLNLDNLAYTLQSGRLHMKERLGFVAKDLGDVIRQLEKYYNDVQDDRILQSTLVDKRKKGKIVQVETIQDALSSWLEGDFPSWERMSTESHMISLPGYPFVGKSYWYNGEPAFQDRQTKQCQGNHYFDKRVIVVEPNKEYKLSLSDDAFFVEDHIVDGEKILPGSVYLEMMRFIFEESTRKSRPVLKNIMWSQPLVFMDTQHRLKIECKGDEEDQKLTIKGSNESTGESIYAQGQVVYEKQSIQPEPIAVLNKQKYRESPSYNREDIYSFFNRMKLQYGPAFQVIDKLWKQENAVIAELNVRPATEDEHFVFHPAILDGALQAIIGFYIEDQESIAKDTFLPFLIKKIQIFKPVNPTCFVYIEESTVGKDQCSFNIKICNKQGDVCISIQDFVVNKLSNNNKRQHPQELLHLKPIWASSKLTINNLQEKAHKIVVFSDSKDIMTALNFKLPSDTKFTLVTPGERNKRISTDHFEVNDKDYAHYDELLRMLKLEGFIPTATIFLQQKGTQSENIEDKLFTSFYRLFNWSKCIIKSDQKSEVKQIVLFEDCSNTDFFSSGLFGLAKTISREYQKLATKVVEVAQSDKLSSDDIADIISHELKDNALHEIRYEGKNRKKLQMTPVVLSGDDNRIMRRQGTYLITGAIGGLGRMLAFYLADKYQADVLLTDIVEPGSKRVVSHLAKLRDKNVAVNYIQADLSNRVSVESLFKNVARNDINGLFHIAGFIKDALVHDKTEQEIQSVFAPKINGTMLVDECSKHLDIDFFAVYSSIAAFSGNVGQADYSYANRFQNAYCEYREQLREKGQRVGKTVAINWPLWEEGGMQTSAETQEYFVKSTGMQALSTESGLKSLELALNSDESHLIVVEGDRDKIYQTLQVTQQQTTKTSWPSPINKRNHITKIVKAQLTAITNVDEKDIDLRTEISDYGLDSVALTSFSNRLNEEFKCDLTPATFFEYSYIDELIQHLETVVEAVLIVEEHEQQGSMEKKSLIQDGLQPESKKNWPSPINKRNHITKIVKAQLTAITNVDEEDIDLRTEISDYGLDSVALTSFSNRLNEEFKCDFTPATFFEYSYIDELIQHLETVVEAVSVVEEHEQQGSMEKKSLIQDGLQPESKKSWSSPINKRNHITKIVKAQLTSITNVDEKDIDLRTEISDYGLDSVALTSLSNRLNEEFKCDLTPATFFEYSYIDELIQHLETVVEAVSVVEEHEQQGSMEKNCLIQDNLQPESVTVSKDENQAIAIIGISGKFPSADNIDDFWENIVSGKSLMKEIPKERWDWLKYFGDPQEEVNKTFVNKCAFMDDVDKFDAGYFKISPREAALMDPVQRMFLECSISTIENAGYKVSSFADSDTGLYVGLINPEYADLMVEQDLPIEAHMATGVSRSIVANRVSYLLDIKGPSEVIDTACSSALVAIDKGVDSIRNGRCKMVLAGGVNVILSSRVHLSYSKAGMLSPDCESKAFDDSANGYARGEGVGAVLLKSLDQAEKDEDHIYGIIRGSAINHGGHANALTAPSPNSQAALLIDAYSQANISPETVSYIEAHGTGTSLGDPIEMNGLKKGFQYLYKKHNLDFGSGHKIAVGAVKTNVGHLEAAAGIAGLFKTLLSIQNKTIPTNRNFTKLNQYIDIADTPFYVSDETVAWPALEDKHGKKLPRRAGVSSFGFGGVNAHMVIEEHMSTDTSEDNGKPQLVVLSALTQAGLKDYAASIVKYLSVREIEFREQGLEEELMLSFIDHVVSQISIITQLPIDEIDVNEGIENLGLDQVTVETVISDINNTFNLAIKSKQFYQLETIEKFCRHCVNSYADEIGSRLTQGLDKVKSTGYSIKLVDLAYTLYHGRDHRSERLAIIATSIQELRTTLEDFLLGNVESGLLIHHSSSKESIRGSVNAPLQEIALSWVAGEDVSNAVQGIVSAGRKVPLPTYPFSKVRHWIKAKECTPEQEKSINTAAPISNKSARIIQFEQESSWVESNSIELLILALDKTDLFRYLLTPHHIDDIMHQQKIKAKYIRLVQAVINILEKEGVLLTNGEKEIVLHSNFTPEILRQRASDAQARLGSILTDKPKYRNHMRLLQTCTENLLRILRGELLPTDVIFPDSRMDLVEDVYKGNISADYYNNQLVNKLNDLILAKQSGHRSGDKIRILEIGAGTGGTSELVLNRIQHFQNMEYFYTDISLAFVKYGKNKYGAHHHFLHAQTLNVEDIEDVKKFRGNGFDIVIAANVLHATTDMNRTLTNINYLLKRGGDLVVNELVKKKNFLTLTFGLLDGWWLFKDENIRIADTPLIKIDRWSSLLDNLRFDNTVFLGVDDLENADQAIIVSTKVEDLIAIEDDIETESISTNVTNNSRFDSEYNYITSSIVQVLATTLDLDPQVVKTDKPYIDFGVDSILAVEGVNRINKKLGIKLRTTDFFNYVTVQDLSQYIRENYSISSHEVIQQIAEPDDSVDREASKKVEDVELLNLLCDLQNGTKSVEEVDEIILSTS
ncbi:SDR family NAD(P)-dependent oxidoreductase [Photobacterium lutimaris]|uniref:Carrier domain-containing protein n=1 Tax=Photobacterium lutimaris TaxID=388278 RepID=A0A2T3J2F7_9GAMM|nr:SDR family NAD(P)-dependent oxidoreductase [Photobacterium lutimaris]PSU35484.1 hypothetical protein C9I99_00215 [Photobacterium lutimaris]TDR78529.1 acyl transferase domain-containing protein [Photobacterium lutimaris]